MDQPEKHYSVELVRSVLNDASNAVSVLFTILVRHNLKGGAAVADEIRASIMEAQKQLGHIESELSAKGRV